MNRSDKRTWWSELFCPQLWIFLNRPREWEASASLLWYSRCFCHTYTHKGALKMVTKNNKEKLWVRGRRMTKRSLTRNKDFYSDAPALDVLKHVIQINDLLSDRVASKMQLVKILNCWFYEIPPVNCALWYFTLTMNAGSWCVWLDESFTSVNSSKTVQICWCKMFQSCGKNIVFTSNRQ